MNDDIQKALGSINLAKQALENIRLAIQSTSSAHARLGKPGDTEAAQWFCALLGFTLPRSYLEVLNAHDGFTLHGYDIFSLSQSIEIMLVFKDVFREQGYWPIGGDGCGNYFVLATQEMEAHECPVYFLEGSEDWQATQTKYPSYAAFIGDVCQANQENSQE